MSKTQSSTDTGLLRRGSADSNLLEPEDIGTAREHLEYGLNEDTVKRDSYLLELREDEGETVVEYESRINKVSIVYDSWNKLKEDLEKY